MHPTSGGFSCLLTPVPAPPLKALLSQPSDPGDTAETIICRCLLEPWHHLFSLTSSPYQLSSLSPLACFVISHQPRLSFSTSLSILLWCGKFPTKVSYSTLLKAVASCPQRLPSFLCKVPWAPCFTCFMSSLHLPLKCLLLKTAVCSVFKSLVSARARRASLLPDLAHLEPLEPWCPLWGHSSLRQPRPSAWLNLSSHLIHLVKPFHYLQALFGCCIPPIFILQQSSLFS